MAKGGLPYTERKRAIISAWTSCGSSTEVSFQVTSSLPESESCQISRPPQCPMGRPAPKSVNSRSRRRNLLVLALPM